jgi:hypothetical protein
MMLLAYVQLRKLRVVRTGESGPPGPRVTSWTSCRTQFRLGHACDAQPCEGSAQRHVRVAAPWPVGGQRE